MKRFWFNEWHINCGPDDKQSVITNEKKNKYRIICWCHCVILLDFSFNVTIRPIPADKQTKTF